MGAAAVWCDKSPSSLAIRNEPAEPVLWEANVFPFRVVMICFKVCVKRSWDIVVFLGRCLVRVMVSVSLAVQCIKLEAHLGYSIHTEQFRPIGEIGTLSGR